MKKRSFTNKFILIIGLLLASQGFAAGEKCAANTTWGEFKTEIASQDTNGYYEIDTPAKLAWFACEVTKWGSASVALNAKLTKSIDLDHKLFIPIAAGKGTPSYGGIFDGQGFTIKNLFIKGSEIKKSENGGKSEYAQNIGLFAALKGGTVKNVSLVNVAIYAASSAGDAGTSGKSNPISVGSIVGYVELGTIEGCAASGKIETSGNSNRVGGITGNVWEANISNCISEVNIMATGNDTHVGGIVGALRNDSKKNYNTPIDISSCVYAGETLFSNNGSVGAIAGNYEKSGGVTVSDLYYTAAYPAVGTGLGEKPFADTNRVANLNTENVICELNGGSWNANNQSCSGASADGAWSEGQNNLSMNGSDGFKVTFDANGGNFTGGVKISKFFAKKASITANEIENPTLAGSKFAGWSLTQGGDVQDLGTAEKAMTVYAVWRSIRTITFNAAPSTFDGGSSVASKNVAEGDVVTVEGLPALPVKFCSQGAEPQCDKYAYFHGWSTEQKAPYADEDSIPEGVVVDLATFAFNSDADLYAVWVESETYTVTFNANGHGQTKVAFVKVGKGETTVQPADPEADDGYVFTNRWCEEFPCDDSTKFNFDTTGIDHSIILYADWSVPDYDITYIIGGVPNTATGNPATYNVESNSITLVKPDSAGHVFDGWYDEDGNKATSILSGSTGAKTFYGSWEPVTYTITYLADTTLSSTTTSDVKQHGVAKVLKGATFVHGGCTQDGWSKVSYGKDGYNLDYAVNGSYEEEKDIILFPHWNCGTFTITYEMFDVPGAENYKTNPSEYTGPAAITLANANDTHNPKRFFMDNWYKESSFKTTIRTIKDISAPITVYAKWYNKIIYNPGSRLKAVNSKLGSTTDKKFLDSSYTIRLEVKNFVLANYTLDGWSTTDGGEKVYELGETYTTNESLTLYPHWVESRDSVQYGAVKIYTYATDGRKEAVIDGAYTGTDTIKIASDITVGSVEFTRTFTPNTMSTLMLPFSIDTSKVSGGKIYRFKRVDVNEETGVWKVIIGRIYTEQVGANTPYLVLPTADKLTFEGPVTFNTTTAPVENAYGLEEGSTWEFKGVYAHTNFDDVQENGPMYAFAGQNKDGAKVGQFKKIGTGVKAYPMQAYLVDHGGITLAKSATGSFGHNFALPDVIDIEIEDENGIVVETGKLNTVTGEVRMDRWFDLKGRRLNSRPTAKGTYYKNGKKAVIK